MSEDFCEGLDQIAKAFKSKEGQAAIRAERRRMAEERLKQLGMRE